MISSIKFDRKCVSVDFPSIEMPFWEFWKNKKFDFNWKYDYQHTVDLNKRAIGCPRIVSEYKDAAEFIWSTTKMNKI